MTSALYGITYDDDVAALRDLYEADIVQLVGGFSDYCGIA